MVLIFYLTLKLSRWNKNLVQILLQAKYLIFLDRSRLLYMLDCIFINNSNIRMLRWLIRNPRNLLLQVLLIVLIAHRWRIYLRAIFSNNCTHTPANTCHPHPNTQGIILALHEAKCLRFDPNFCQYKRNVYEDFQYKRNLFLYQFYVLNYYGWIL